MKLSIFLFTCSFFFFSCQSKTADEQHGPTTLTPQELKSYLQNDTHQVLDVRTSKEWEEGTITNSPVKIDMQKENFSEEAVKQLDQGKPVIVYCKVGKRSLKAAQILDSLGFKDVYHLDGGIDEWEKEGYDVEQ